MLVLAAMLGVWAGGAAADSPGLTFVSPDEVGVTIDGEGSSTTSVWLENDGAEAVEPSFSVLLEDDDGEAVDSTVKVASGGDLLAAGGVARYRLSMEGAADSSGQLVASAPGLAPATVALAVAPGSVADRGVDGALLFPLGVAVALIAVAWFVSVRPASLGAPLGALDFKFSEGFASSLTAAGALLGTIISAGVLPEETVYLSKEGFTGLNLVFGVAVIVAALIYAAAQRPKWVPVDGKPREEERKFEGVVWGFLLASLVTVWAVFGELWTLWLLIEELGQDSGFSGLAVIVVKVLLAAAALAMIPYTLTRTKAIIEAKRIKPTDVSGWGEAKPEPAHPISLL